MRNSSSDVIIIGGGIIGISLALELRARGANVRVLERGEPGHEASHAGAGILGPRDPETPECLRELAMASAEMYPEWIARLEAKTGLRADLRREGTIYLSANAKEGLDDAVRADKLSEMELLVRAGGGMHAYRTDEGSVDPRALVKILLAAAKDDGVVISHEHPVTAVEIGKESATGVLSGNNRIAADVIVNCAGAWAGEIAGVNVPSLPVKGQMLAVVDPHDKKQNLRHVVRGDDVYLVPRSDGRILIGATVERVGFDKGVEPETILRLQHEATKLVPRVAEMRIQESWAGLRPGTPDQFPILGGTQLKNYFVATGHYRNGILLAPITAKVMADFVHGDDPGFELSRFALSRFRKVIKSVTSVSRGGTTS